MRLLALFLIAFACVPRMDAEGRVLVSAAPPTLPAQFGMPVRFDLGTLQYPGFTVHLIRKDDLLRANGSQPWTVYTIEVLNEGRITIGGDLIFNSEERANGRRFDVAGKIYVAEMFYSTAGLKEGEAAPIAARLAPNEIVIWDEATATTRNVSLAKIWRNETIEPGARFFPAHAYASGTFLPGFSPTERPEERLYRLKPGSIEIERITVMADASAPPDNAVPCAYGERADFRVGAMKFPNMTVVFVSRTETNPTNPLQAGMKYGFKAFGQSSPASFDFNTYNLANGRSFTVDGVMYFAEMFSTTASASPRADGKSAVNIPLRPSQLIIWNEATARRQNPLIVAAFGGKSAETRYAQAFAAGTSLGIGFSGTFTIGSKNDLLNGWCDYRELDAPFNVLKDGTVVYPARFAGSGYVGHVGGYLFVERDGTVSQAMTSSGNDNSFEEPSAQAIRSMRFTIPMRDGRPARVLLMYTWSIAEPNCDTTSVRFN